MSLPEGHPVIVFHEGEEHVARVTEAHSDECVSARLADGQELTSLRLVESRGDVQEGEYFVQRDPAAGASARAAKRAARSIPAPADQPKPGRGEGVLLRSDKRQTAERVAALRASADELEQTGRSLRQERAELEQIATGGDTDFDLSPALDDE